MVSGVEIVAIDFIKPSTPIPNHLKLHKLSLLDQLAPIEYIPLVLYYGDNNSAKRATISQQLKESLSKTLVHFYPFAGRISINDASVECTGDDIGVPYKEANVVGASCSLKDMLEKRDYEMVKQFLPSKGLFEGAEMIPLQIQATFFQCSGIALGFCISHLMADAVVLCEFIRSWAIIAQLGQLVMDPPDFMTVSSLLPPRRDLVKLHPPEMTTFHDGAVTKAFKFSASSIAALKANAAVPVGGAGTRPTRVQAVTAIIWKCLMNIATSKLSISNSKTKLTTNTSVLQVYVNMRTRLNPPLPENTPGNFIEFFTIQKNYDDHEDQNINLHELIGLQTNGLKEFCNNHIEKLQDSTEDMSSVALAYVQQRQKTLMRDDVDLFVVSSWCGFKFYEADFGWGKPIWVSTYYSPYCNFFMLIDTKEGDGVEAWVSLKKEDMAAFEQHQELLSFVSPTPTISNN